MKQVLNVGIGGRSFVIDEDAFDRLNSYLNAFRSKTGMGYQTAGGGGHLPRRAGHRTARYA